MASVKGSFEHMRQSPPRFTRSPVTWATYGLLGLFAYMEAILGPLMPFLKAERHFGYTVAGLHFAAFALGSVAAGVTGDRIESHFGRQTILWGGAAGMAATALLLVVTPWVPAAIASALLMGFFGALLVIATQMILADRHGPWAPVAITESNVAASLCAILASFAVGFLARTDLGWRSVMALPVAAFVFLRFRFARERVDRTSDQEAGRDPSPRGLPARFWIYAGLLFLAVSVEWSMAYWAADFLDIELGMSRSSAATGLTLFFAGMLVGRIAGSRLARALETDRLLLVCLCVTAAGFPVFWLASSPATGLLGLFATGSGLGSVYPLTVSRGISAASPRTGAATARLALAAASALLVAPLLLGVVAEAVGIEGAYGLVIPMLVLAIGLVVVGARSYSRSA
jgi:fucose permease